MKKIHYYLDEENVFSTDEDLTYKSKIEKINPFAKIQQYKYEESININGEPEKLADFLKYLSLTHTWYHHYTTLESLEKILKNHTFIMTKGASRKLNDLHEIDEKGVRETWERTYITCFGYTGEESINYTSNTKGNFRGEENMAMWGLYGKPKSEAIRISFPRETFFKLVNKASVKVKTDDTNNINEDIIDEIYPTDVFYAKGSNKDSALEFQTHIDKRIEFGFYKINNDKEDNRLFEFLKNNKLTGCVKNYSWHYEDEVRIIARIKKVEENDNNVKNDVKKVLKKNSIFLNIPDDLLKSFTITTGPNFTKDKELAELLMKHKITTSLPSVLCGKVNYNDLYGDIGEAIVDASDKIASAIKIKK